LGIDNGVSGRGGATVRRERERVVVCTGRQARCKQARQRTRQGKASI